MTKQKCALCNEFKEDLEEIVFSNRNGDMWFKKICCGCEINLREKVRDQFCGNKLHSLGVPL